MTFEQKLRKRRQNIGGFTLLEVMIAAGILALAALALTAVIHSFTNNQKTVRQMALRDQLYHQLRTVVDSPATLWTSMNHWSNFLFRNCVMPQGQAGAGSCSSFAVGMNNQRSIALYMPRGNGTKRIASGLFPVYYDNKGKSGCNRNHRDCLFAARSWFYATCPNGASSCPEASTVNIRFQLQIARNWAGVKKTADPNLKNLYPMDLHNVPPDNEFNGDPSSFAIPFLADEIRGMSTTTCGDPAAIVRTFEIGAGGGYAMKSGELKCKCPNNFNTIADPGVAGGVRCELLTDIAFQCPTDQVMVGILDNGKPKCVLMEQSTNCWDVADFRVDGDCGDGNWVNSIEQGKCTGTGTTAKKGPAAPPTEITCEESPGKCCSEAQ